MPTPHYTATMAPPRTRIPDRHRSTSPGAGPDLLALDRQVCFALAVASRTVVSLYRPLLEPMGLTHPQYLVMLALWEAEPLRVSELADRLSLEPATLSPLLKRLEAAGLVDPAPRPRRRARRGGDPHPGRARASAAEAERIPPAVMARLGMGLTELEELRDRLTTVIEAGPARRVSRVSGRLGRA